jgi:hypothetical protein
MSKQFNLNYGDFVKLTACNICTCISSESNLDTSDRSEYCLDCQRYLES